MGKKEQNFIQKNRIDMSSIMYLTREGRKTVLHSKNGTTWETFLTMKGILEDLPEGMFRSINKGIAIAPKYLDYEQDNVYTMIDGVAFSGRIRMTRQQRQQVLSHDEEQLKTSWDPCNILENMPLAFCVIELIFDENYHGIDFVFRYCNKEMEKLEGKTLEEMMNNSFYEVFKNGDKKWLVAYADVALNGGQRVLESFSPEINANLRIYCYQLKPGFCGCLLVKL